MKLIGLTGGIGMGKSKAAEILANQGLPVIDTDDLARQVVATGQPALGEIRKEFGEDVFLAHGELDRPKLARLIFSDLRKRQALESILHPRIRSLWELHVGFWRQEGRPTGVVVIPLLFETGSESGFDWIICMACGPDTQRNRLQARSWGEGETRDRISAQMPVGEKMTRSNFVVWTEGSIDIHLAQIKRILSLI